jgi:hypothetical protein
MSLLFNLLVNILEGGIKSFLTSVIRLIGTKVRHSMPSNQMNWLSNGMYSPVLCCFYSASHTSSS